MSESDGARRLDLRGLPPPEPLMRSLEAAAALGHGEELVILTDQRPVHLLPILLERGLVLEGRPLDDGHELRVRRGLRG